MTQVKTAFIKSWSLISDGSPEENNLCYAWIGLNILAVSAFVLTKVAGI